MNITCFSPEHKKFPIFFQSGSSWVFPGSKSLHAVLTGDEALRVEAQDDSKTMEEVMEVLRNMYGPSIPNATGTNITNSLEEQFYHFLILSVI